MEEYIVGLRIRVEKEVLKQYGGDITELILKTTKDVPFLFDIEDCKQAKF